MPCIVVVVACDANTNMHTKPCMLMSWSAAMPSATHRLNLQALSEASCVFVSYLEVGVQLAQPPLKRSLLQLSAAIPFLVATNLVWLFSFYPHLKVGVQLAQLLLERRLLRRQLRRRHRHEAGAGGMHSVIPHLPAGLLQQAAAAAARFLRPQRRLPVDVIAVIVDGGEIVHQASAAACVAAVVPRVATKGRWGAAGAAKAVAGGGWRAPHEHAGALCRKQLRRGAGGGTPCCRGRAGALRLRECLVTGACAAQCARNI